MVSRLDQFSLGSLVHRGVQDILPADIQFIALHYGTVGDLRAIKGFYVINSLHAEKIYETLITQYLNIDSAKVFEIFSEQIFTNTWH